MAIKLVLFDLDDTLYPEITYVYSGFTAVSEMIARDHDAQELLVHRMKDSFRTERAGVFNRLLEDDGAQRLLSPAFRRTDRADSDERTVASMVACYRQHTPNIQLYPDAIEALFRIASGSLRVGIITDGHKDVQEKKVVALGLRDAVEHVVFTDSLAMDRLYWKPSPYPFELALELFREDPSETCYVADNPTKDFAGPYAVGIRTIQVLRTDGLYSALPAVQRPEWTIHSLRDLFSLPVFCNAWEHNENRGGFVED